PRGAFGRRARAIRETSRGAKEDERESSVKSTSKRINLSQAMLRPPDFEATRAPLARSFQAPQAGGLGVSPSFPSLGWGGANAGGSSRRRGPTSGPSCPAGSGRRSHAAGGGAEQRSAAGGAARRGGWESVRAQLDGDGGRSQRPGAEASRLTGRRADGPDPDRRAD